MLRRETPPAMLAPRARLVEELGFDAAWVVEDCFWTAGIAAAAVALAATDELGVGIGILPAVLRNPAVAAMELATLAGAFPERLTAGFGHGVAEWMHQVGAHPASPLAALEETMQAVGDLSGARRFTREGRHVALRDVELVFPPRGRVPLWPGSRARAPRAGRRAAGRHRPARERDPGVRPRCRRPRARGADRTRRSHVVVFAWLGVADEAERGRDLVRPGAGGVDRGVPRAAAARGPRRSPRRPRRSRRGRPKPWELPGAWVDELAVAGDRRPAARRCAGWPTRARTRSCSSRPRRTRREDLRRFSEEVRRCCGGRNRLSR
jgi:alkanesulfonate monooxygenase SsuD/methylene tetrahydromethanopterin reductase-like flavin-dependent oxidoreductase (luciferase family)